jgi:GNAT superfamily N-acetyltransferase
MSLVVAHATAADAETIAALHAASWRAAYRGIMPDDFLDRAVFDDRLNHWRARMKTAPSTQVVLKAVDDGVVCGFACTYLDADETWGALLDNLHVAPASIGRGIGVKLLAETFDYVRRVRPKSRLHLWVFEANSRARRFYERHGGTAVEEKNVEVLPGISAPEVRYVWNL